MARVSCWRLVGLGVQDSRLEVLGLRLWGLGVWGSGYKVLVGFGKVASSFCMGLCLTLCRVLQGAQVSGKPEPLNPIEAYLT